MSQKSRNIVGRAARAVVRLVEVCRKGGPLYVENPKAVAHVSRTGKWLLNAITQLDPEFAAGKEAAAS
jgi:hypothetical protein